MWRDDSAEGVASGDMDEGRVCPSLIVAMPQSRRITAEGTLAGVGRWMMAAIGMAQGRQRELPHRGTGDTRQRCCRLLDGTVGGNGVAAQRDRGHSATVLPIT